ncbi:hypothetical protein ACOMHN_053011 [Nucella lapillus]
MEKEAEGILKTQLSLYEKTRSFWNECDLTSKQLQDQIEAVRDSYTAFGKLRHGTKVSFRSKLISPLIDSGTFGIVCDIVVKTLEEDAYFTTDERGRRTEIQGQAMMLVDCLHTIHRFTDIASKAGHFVVDHEKLLPLLVRKLDGWYPSHMDGTGLDIEQKVVTKSLTVLFMVAAVEDRRHTDHLRDIQQFLPVASKYLSSKTGNNRLRAIGCLAYLAKEAEAEEIATDKDIVRFLLEEFQRAYRKKDLVSPAGWTITRLARVVKNLARNDANKRLLVQEGALPVLMAGFREENQRSHKSSERKCCMESLWWLSFDRENQEEISKNEDLLDRVVDIYQQGPGSDGFAAAEGFLYQLRDHLKMKEKYATIAAKFLEDKSSSSPSVETSHIMMSYQTQNRPIVKSICDFLQEKGFRVWMDVYNMAEGEESTLQTMAEAVEGSAVVLMGVSETYKSSPYCRGEAEYAFMKGKHIIPLKLQAGYTPDGWLGFIQGSKFFYDFTKEGTVEQKRQQLLEAVQKATANTGQSGQSAAAGQHQKPTSAPASTMEDKIKRWTQEEVKKWLDSYSLKGEKLEALKADEILYLHKLKSKAPEHFHSVVREELALTGLSLPAAFSRALDELDDFTAASH